MLSKHLITLVVALSGALVQATSDHDAIGNVWFDESEKCAGPWDAKPSSYTEGGCISREIKGSVWIYGPYDTKDDVPGDIRGCMYLYPEAGCSENDDGKGMWSFSRHDQCANIPKREGLGSTWGSVRFIEQDCDWDWTHLKSDCVMNLEDVTLADGTAGKKPVLDTCTPDPLY